VQCLGMDELNGQPSIYRKLVSRLARIRDGATRRTRAQRTVFISNSGNSIARRVLDS
jgi:hypothetical protein